LANPPEGLSHESLHSILSDFVDETAHLGVPLKQINGFMQIELAALIENCARIAACLKYGASV
jgi:hypothetical protein